MSNPERLSDIIARMDRPWRQEQHSTRGTKSASERNAASGRPEWPSNPFGRKRGLLVELSQKCFRSDSEDSERKRVEN